MQKLQPISCKIPNEEKKGMEGEKSEGKVKSKKTQFEEKSLSKDYWDRVEKDLKVQQDQPAQCKKQSNLSAAD